MNKHEIDRLLPDAYNAILTGGFIKDGKIDPANGLSKNGLHWVTNHRVQLMTKYNF